MTVHEYHPAPIMHRTCTAAARMEGETGDEYIHRLKVHIKNLEDELNRYYMMDDAIRDLRRAARIILGEEE